MITGGVFELYGASVEEVRNRGPVTTYGVNDMVLTVGGSSTAGSRKRRSPRMAPAVSAW